MRNPSHGRQSFNLHLFKNNLKYYICQIHKRGLIIKNSSSSSKKCFTCFKVVNSLIIKEVWSLTLLSNNIVTCEIHVCSISATWQNTLKRPQMVSSPEKGPWVKVCFHIENPAIKLWMTQMAALKQCHTKLCCLCPSFFFCLWGHFLNTPWAKTLQQAVIHLLAC